MEIEKEPEKLAESYKDLGNTEFRKGNFLKAIEQYTKAIGSFK